MNEAASRNCIIMKAARANSLQFLNEDKTVLHDVDPFHRREG